jgi:chromosome segregation ATPase
MKIDADRKDALIAEQRAQISELQRYREQFYSTKAQLQLAEEKMRLQEAELSRASALQDRFAAQLQLGDEKVRQQEAELLRNATLQDRLKVVQAENDRLRAELRTTQHVLTDTSDNLNRERYSRRMLDEVKKRVRTQLAGCVTKKTDRAAGGRAQHRVGGVSLALALACAPFLSPGQLCTQRNTKQTRLSV